jgi:hypothetical protein
MRDRLNRQWEEFIADVPWFVPRGQEAEVGVSEPPGFLTLASSSFAQLFPELGRLLRDAFVTPIAVAGTRYQLYSWYHRNGESCGWLSPLRSADAPSSLHPELRILLSSFGGIVQRLHEPVWWVLNHNDVLTQSEARNGATFIKEHYSWAFKEAGVEIPIALEEFYSIAQEANGNTTFCHRLTGEIVLFAPDHAFDHIEPYPGCSEYSLYRVHGALHFRDWVNTIALQWRGWIESDA